MSDAANSATPTTGPTRPSLAARPSPSGKQPGRLEVNEVEGWVFQVLRPDSRLAHQIEELADAR